MTDLAHKTCLVIDFGQFTSLAVRLAKDFGSTYYYVPYEDTEPTSNKTLIGYGMDGVTRIMPPEHWAKYIDKVDLIYFPDTYYGDLFEWLKLHGYPVAGAGKSQILELDRWESRQMQKHLGLPTQDTMQIIGIANLRKYLEDPRHKNKYVKLNVIRGTIQSFPHHDWEYSQPLIDYLASTLGPKQDLLEFTVEDMVGEIEPGLDGIVYDGEWLSPCLWGYEYNDHFLVEKVCDFADVPEPVRLINEKFAPMFEKMGTRFFSSTEVRVAKNGQGFMIDWSNRQAAPCVSHCQCELYENFSEIIWGLGNGIKIAPKIKAENKYVAAIAVESPWLDDRWTKVKIGQNVKQWFKLCCGTKFHRDYYCPPGFSTIGSMIGFGKTPQAAIDLVKERVQEISAYQLEVSFTGFDRIMDQIGAGEKIMRCKF